MQQYKDLIKDILENGSFHADRTGVNTQRVFGRMLRFNLQDGFPAVTVKKTPVKLALRELLFFLSGGNNLNTMHTSIQHWWKDFASDSGYLGGGTYGTSLRHFGSEDNEGFDQVAFIINQIKYNPNSRRLLLTTYNPCESAFDLEFNELFNARRLYPCHGIVTQFQVVAGKLNCITYQRSCDVLLGFSVNICEYAYLTHILANICDLEAWELVYTIADAHIYSNHIEQCKEILTREPLPLPTLKINRKLTSIDDLREEDFELVGYQSHPAIKGEMAI